MSGRGTTEYVTLIDNGNDLRIDGDIFSNHGTWYAGTPAVNRCGGANPCSAATCGDWIRPGGPTDNILMCGHSIYVDHSGGSTPTILSARTIATTGGWQARSKNDIIHADQLAPSCVAHPKNLGYPTPFLQETNVCIGVPQIVDPLNDPGDPGTIMPLPDYEALSTCPGGLVPLRAGRLGHLRGRARDDAADSRPARSPVPPSSASPGPPRNTRSARASTTAGSGQTGTPVTRASSCCRAPTS